MTSICDGWWDVGAAIVVHVKDNRVTGWMIGRDIKDLINQCRGHWVDEVCCLADELSLHDPPMIATTELEGGYW